MPTGVYVRYKVLNYCLNFNNSNRAMNNDNLGLVFAKLKDVNIGFFYDFSFNILGNNANMKRVSVKPIV